MTAHDLYTAAYGAESDGSGDSTSNELIEGEYIPAWSYITIVEKTIDTQTMLVTLHPMF